MEIVYPWVSLGTGVSSRHTAPAGKVNESSAADGMQFFPLMRLSGISFRAAAVAISFVNGAAAQNLSIGILGGGGLTDGFSTRSSPDGTRLLSTSKDYLIGPAMEWRF